MKLRTDVQYVTPDGRLTQAGWQALQGQLDEQSGTSSSVAASVAALGVRVTAAEGYISGSSQGPTATTSGTAFSFSGFASTVTEINVFLDGVSLTGTDVILFQAIVAGSPVTSGYGTGSGRSNTGGALGATRTDGWFVLGPTAATTTSGGITLLKFPGANKWTGNGAFRTAAADAVYSGGFISLSGAIEGIRMTRSGTNTFDAGAWSVTVR